jgi:hypothetical protein
MAPTGDLSYTDRLLMASKDMTDALQNPHPEVPFASVRDDTIKALADLAAIFKLKLQQAPSPVTQDSPAKIIQRPNLIPFPAQISTLPMPAHAHQAANEITDDNSHSIHPR